MSEIIVGKITPPASQPLVIDGTRTIKVDVIQDHLGETKKVSKLTSVHPEADADDATDYEFVYYGSTGVLSFKTPGGFVDVVSGSTQIFPDGFQEISLPNYQVTNTWQVVPAELSTHSGTYAVNVSVVDSGSKRAIYSGVLPFLNKADQPILADSITSIPLTRVGEDNSALELRLVRLLSGNSIKFEIKGANTPTLPHKTISIKIRSIL